MRASGSRCGVGKSADMSRARARFLAFFLLPFFLLLSYLLPRARGPPPVRRFLRNSAEFCGQPASFPGLFLVFCPRKCPRTFRGQVRTKRPVRGDQRQQSGPRQLARRLSIHAMRWRLVPCQCVPAEVSPDARNTAIVIGIGTLLHMRRFMGVKRGVLLRPNAQFRMYSTARLISSAIKYGLM